VTCDIHCEDVCRKQPACEWTVLDGYPACALREYLPTRQPTHKPQATTLSPTPP